MKQFILIMGLVIEADPLQNECTTLIRSIENIVESNDIYELEQMGADWLANGGTAYKVLDRTHEHEGVAWSHKAVMQLEELCAERRIITDFNLN